MKIGDMFYEYIEMHMNGEFIEDKILWEIIDIFDDVVIACRKANKTIKRKFLKSQVEFYGYTKI